jgi:hypothetical protein
MAEDDGSDLRVINLVTQTLCLTTVSIVVSLRLWVGVKVKKHVNIEDGRNFYFQITRLRTDECDRVLLSVLGRQTLCNPSEIV